MIVVAGASAEAEMQSESATARGRWRDLLAPWSFRRVSALYVFVFLFVALALWVPETFLTRTTWTSLLGQNATNAIVAVGLVVPLAARTYDLSVGFTAGLSGIASSWLMVKHGEGTLAAIGFGLLVGVAVGVLNGTLVVRFRIDSFIATLAVASTLEAMMLLLSGGQYIVGVNRSFQRIATQQLGGVVLPVYYLLALCLMLWYLLDHTPTGRYLYATGGNVDAARLAGLRTNRLVFGSLVASSTVASAAGMLVAGRVGAGAPDVGPSLLLPAVAAAFLGGTQIHPGRFNVWGTILAVYVLATGVKGLELVGAPRWVPGVFTSMALLVAVGAAARGHSTRGRSGAPRDQESDNNGRS